MFCLTLSLDVQKRRFPVGPLHEMFCVKTGGCQSWQRNIYLTKVGASSSELTNLPGSRSRQSYPGCQSWQVKPAVVKVDDSPDCQSWQSLQSSKVTNNPNCQSWQNPLLTKCLHPQKVSFILAPALSAPPDSNFCFPGKVSSHQPLSNKKLTLTGHTCNCILWLDVTVNSQNPVTSPQRRISVYKEKVQPKHGR